MLVCSSPPGSGLSQSDSDRYMRSVKPPRTRSSPSSTNSGIATSTKLFVAPQYCVPNCSAAGQPRYITAPAMLMANMTKATCRPSDIRPMSSAKPTTAAVRSITRAPFASACASRSARAVSSRLELVLRARGSVEPVELRTSAHEQHERMHRVGHRDHREEHEPDHPQTLRLPQRRLQRDWWPRSGTRSTLRAPNTRARPRTPRRPPWSPSPAY